MLVDVEDHPRPRALELDEERDEPRFDFVAVQHLRAFGAPAPPQPHEAPQSLPRSRCGAIQRDPNTMNRCRCRSPLVRGQVHDIVAGLRERAGLFVEDSGVVEPVREGEQDDPRDGLGASLRQQSGKEKPRDVAQAGRRP